jgi:hypothetical protein
MLILRGEENILDWLLTSTRLNKETLATVRRAIKEAQITAGE